MSDLVERLRKKPAYHSWSECWPLNKEAADEIERLSCEVSLAFGAGFSAAVAEGTRTTLEEAYELWQKERV